MAFRGNGTDRCMDKRLQIIQKHFEVLFQCLGLEELLTELIVKLINTA